MLVTWFGCQNQCFGVWEFGTIFRSLRSTRRPITLWRGCRRSIMGCRRSRTTSRSKFPTLLVMMLETCFWLWTSYIPFLTFRSIWIFWKWSQMIPQTPKHGFWHKNHVSNMLRSWVTPQVRISLLEVLLDLLQPLHPVLGLQHARDLILVSSPRVLGMGNPWRPFSKWSQVAKSPFIC